MDKHKGDLKIEFLHPHGPKKYFKGQSLTDKCFVAAAASNIFYALSQPQQQSMGECIESQTLILNKT